MNPSRDKIYVVNFSSNNITVIDGVTKTVETVATPGAVNPSNILVNPATNRIYVLSSASSNLTVIDGGAPYTPSPPSCQLTGILIGPPKQLNITMQDPGSGLQSINLAGSVNSTVAIPAFSPGTTSPVPVTATKIDQSLSSEVSFQVSDMSGITTSCDPLDFTVSLEGFTEEHTFRNLPASEHYVRIANGKPGVRQMMFDVNGRRFPVPDLGSGGRYLLDIGSAMVSDNRGNKVTIYTSDPRGAAAYVIIGDAAVE